MSRNFIDRFYEEDTKDSFWSLNKKIGACFVVLLLTVIMINTSGCTQNGTEEVSVEDASVAEIPQDTVKVGNDGVNAAIAPDDVAIVADQKGLKDSAMVSLSVEDMGRSDPFCPKVKKLLSNQNPNLQQIWFRHRK